ncbi:MAG: hypothetical protein AB1295_06350 [Candidatus Micrarchaeota archaeon]
MEMYLLAFVAGLFVKIVDWLDDDLKSKHPIKYALAIAYGILLGYLIAMAPFAALFLAALIAQVFARKVDTLAHRLGFTLAALSLIYFGFPSLDLALVTAFLFLAFLDEIDFVGKLRPLNDWRPFLKLGALAPAIIGNWSYFAGIISFDVGYHIVGWAGERFAKKPKAATKKPARKRK